MAPGDDLFGAVQALLDTLADTPSEALRIQVYGRHDAQGRFSWDDEASLIAAIADPRGTAQRLVAPLDYANMTDAEIGQQCKLVFMLSSQSPGASPAMPRLRAGTNRRYATADEIETIIIPWLRALPFPRN
jgi:hypothetical protein